MLKLTPEIWKKIQEINSDRNDRIQYVKDKTHYGKSDYWAFPDDDQGDCEDISIAKQYDLEDIAMVKQSGLKAKGIESFLATCWCYPNKPVGQRGYHAVCVVSTDYGDYILDNRFPMVYHFEDCNYLWAKREMEDGTWRKIKA